MLAYSRTNAINYGYAWWNGQNSSYPDFGSNDCTNFISQINEGWRVQLSERKG
ncbi:MAG: amidase domain-containing protein [Anaerolineae bacterium]|nr:amidase domain-containing protein [Anaerolineae bacterium]